MDRRRRERAFEALDRVTELPMLVLALAMVPLLIAPLALDLSDRTERALFGLDWIIWALFALELTAKTYLAPSRRIYLTSHWFDVVIVAVPFLRPLRIVRSARALRLLRSVRLLSVVVRGAVTARAILQRHGLQYVLLGGLAFIVVVAALVALVERDANGGIDDLGTAIWWALTTVTTVGYGDVVPVTAAGRGIGVLMMVVGVGIFGVLTANIAAFFVQRDASDEQVTNERLLAEIQKLGRRIGELERDREPGAPDAESTAMTLPE